MLQKHSDSLGDKQRFWGILRDYFPQEPMTVNLMLSLYELGIHSRIENAQRVTNDIANRFVNRLMLTFLFERSHVHLNKWIFAIYKLVTATKGVTSLQLSK